MGNVHAREACDVGRQDLPSVKLSVNFKPNVLKAGDGLRVKARKVERGVTPVTNLA